MDEDGKTATPQRILTLSFMLIAFLVTLLGGTALYYQHEDETCKSLSSTFELGFGSCVAWELNDGKLLEGHPVKAGDKVALVVDGVPLAFAQIFERAGGKLDVTFHLSRGTDIVEPQRPTPMPSSSVDTVKERAAAQDAEAGNSAEEAPTPPSTGPPTPIPTPAPIAAATPTSMPPSSSTSISTTGPSVRSLSDLMVEIRPDSAGLAPTRVSLCRSPTTTVGMQGCFHAAGSFRIFHPRLIWIGAALAFSFTVWLCLLAYFTNIIKVPGTSKYSLSRTQLLFWFTIVTMGYLAIYFLTGRTEGLLSVRTLALLGIYGVSSGIAISTDLKDPPTGKSYGFWNDILSEGEDGNVAIQRVAAITWSFILGAILIQSVFQRFVLPDFENAQLALAGFSSGAYAWLKRGPSPDGKAH